MNSGDRSVSTYLEKTNAILEAIKSTATVLAIIVGAGFTIWQIGDLRQEERVERSLEMVKRSSTDPILEHSLHIEDAWTAAYKLREPIRKSESKEAYDKFVVDFVRETGLTNSLIIVLSYLCPFGKAA